MSTPPVRFGFLGAGERRMAGLGVAVLLVITLAVVVAQRTAA